MPPHPEPPETLSPLASSQTSLMQGYKGSGVKLCPYTDDKSTVCCRTLTYKLEVQALTLLMLAV